MVLVDKPLPFKASDFKKKEKPPESPSAGTDGNPNATIAPATVRIDTAGAAGANTPPQQGTPSNATGTPSNAASSPSAATAALTKLPLHELPTARPKSVPGAGFSAFSKAASTVKTTSSVANAFGGAGAFKSRTHSKPGVREGFDAEKEWHVAGDTVMADKRLIGNREINVFCAEQKPVFDEDGEWVPEWLENWDQMRFQVEVGNLDWIRGESWSCCDVFGWTIIHFAANSDSKDVLQLVASEQPRLFKACLERGEKDHQRPLHIATKANAVQALNVLLAHRANVAALDFNGFTPLIAGAIHAREPKAVAALAAVCPKDVVDAGDKNGNTAMHWATIHGHLECCKVLICNAAGLNAKNNDGQSPIEAAQAYRNQLIVVQEVYELNVEMLEAAKNKQTEIVAECLKKGAQLDAVEDEGGWSALMWAAINGKIDLMELLIKKGASVHLKDHVGRTVAEYAGKMGNHASVMEELFKCNKTLIKAAELRQSVKPALDLKAFPDYVPSDSVARWTPLIWASFNGNINNLKLLIGANGDPRKRDICGEDAKFACVRGTGSVEVMDHLMKAQRELQIKIIREQQEEKEREKEKLGFPMTPAEQLAKTMAGLEEVAKEESLKEFLTVKSYNNDETLLQIAVDADRPQVVKWLLDLEPSLMQMTDGSGTLPFLSACKQGKGSVIRTFLKYFTDPIFRHDYEDDIPVDVDNVSKGLGKIAEKAPRSEVLYDRVEMMKPEEKKPTIVLVGTAGGTAGGSGSGSRAGSVSGSAALGSVNGGSKGKFSPFAGAIGNLNDLFGDGESSSGASDNGGRAEASKALSSVSKASEGKASEGKGGEGGEEKEKAAPPENVNGEIGSASVSVVAASREISKDVSKEKSITNSLTIQTVIPEKKGDHPLCEVFSIGDVILEETHESNFSTAFIRVDEGASLHVPRSGFLVEISVGKNAHGVLKPRFDKIGEDPNTLAAVLNAPYGGKDGSNNGSVVENGDGVAGGADKGSGSESASSSKEKSLLKNKPLYFLYEESGRSSSSTSSFYQPVCELTKSCTCVPQGRLKVLPLPEPGKLHYGGNCLQRISGSAGGGSAGGGGESGGVGAAAGDDVQQIAPGNLLYFQNAPVTADKSSDADALAVCAGETYLYVENLLELTETNVLVRADGGGASASVDEEKMREFLNNGDLISRYATGERQGLFEAIGTGTGSGSENESDLPLVQFLGFRDKTSPKARAKSPRSVPGSNSKSDTGTPTRYIAPRLRPVPPSLIEARNHVNNILFDNDVPSIPNTSDEEAHASIAREKALPALLSTHVNSSLAVNPERNSDRDPNAAATYRDAKAFSIHPSSIPSVVPTPNSTNSPKALVNQTSKFTNLLGQFRARAFTFNTIEGHGFYEGLSPLHLCVKARDPSGFIALINHSEKEHAWISRLIFTAPNLLLLAVESNTYDIVKYIISGEIKNAYKDAGIWSALMKNALLRCRKRASELSHIRELLKPFEKVSLEDLEENAKTDFEVFILNLPWGIDAPTLRDFLEVQLMDQMPDDDTDPNLRAIIVYRYKLDWYKNVWSWFTLVPVRCSRKGREEPS